MDYTNSILIKKTLTGREFNKSNLIELHLQRISEDMICAAYSLGYYDEPIIGTAHWVINSWRVLGVRFWSHETLDFVAKVFFHKNNQLTDEEKEYGLFLAVFSACLFCVDRSLVHARRNNISAAEMWLSAAQELRFFKLGSGFSYQKSIAKSGGNARDIKQGYQSRREEIRKIWASGKYSNRDLCAEQECANLNMSFSTARKALRGTPDPT